jgi:predicted MFS family arabinose efflux permease
VTTTSVEERTDRLGWFTRYRSALARPDLRRLFGGLVISATGDWAYNVVLLAFVFDRTRSLTWVGAAGLARFIPQLALSSYGGVLAERTERIRLMVGSDLVRGLLQAGLAALAATSGPPALALVLAALSSATGVAYLPAVAATIPSIVEEEDLAAANALNGTIDQLVVIVGPAVGAVLLLASSPAAVFALNAASFIASAALVSRITVRSRPVDVTEGGSAGPLRQMLVGIRTIAALPAARTLVAYSVLVSFVYGTDSVLFVAVSAHRLGTGAKGFGYLLAGLGIGGILIAGAVDRLAGSRRLAAIILIGAIGYCVPTALLTVIHAPVLAFAVQVLRGSATLVVDVLAVTALQRAVDPDQLARVFGVFFAIVLGAIALGTVITPPIISAFGLNTALWVMAIGPTLICLAGYPALAAVDRETSDTARGLAPRVALLETLGLFAGATRTTLERLAATATTESYRPAATIVREGDTADAVYVLTDGEAEVRAHGDGEQDHPLAVIRAPSYFGEIGVLERCPRTATVMALTDCRCERIEARPFLEALTVARASSGLMETARSRLAATNPARQLGFTETSP